MVSLIGCSHFVIILNLVVCKSIDSQVRNIVGERNCTHSKITQLILSI